MKGGNKKEQLTDIWKDVHRIKHKKDRDHHPCQLPTKLMERIIKLFSNEGDLAFDPFAGAGTTAIAAKVLNRKFIVTEIDQHYIDVSRKNIASISTFNGKLEYKRKSIKKIRSNAIPKKIFEKRYFDLCFKNKGAIKKEELATYDFELQIIAESYKGDFKKLYSTARRKIEFYSYAQASSV